MRLLFLPWDGWPRSAGSFYEADVGHPPSMISRIGKKLGNVPVFLLSPFFSREYEFSSALFQQIQQDVDLNRTSSHEIRFAVIVDVANRDRQRTKRCRHFQSRLKCSIAIAQDHP